jgi:plasmid stability protein
MAARTVTLIIPDDLYGRLQRRAADARRSVEDEALEAVAMALPTVDDLPPEIAGELARLDDLDDDALWQAARRTLASRDDRRLRALTRKRRQATLSVAEEMELERLLDRLENIGLIRARGSVAAPAWA